ncbi:Zinc-type alcohol dehydrogenase-like protein [compost metagenome]
MASAIAPQGIICSIVETHEPLDLNLLKDKSAAFVWEFMFTRAKYETPDLIQQHLLLNQVADLIDNGSLKTTLASRLEPIHAANLRKAHQLVESGSMIGKVVLEHW